VNNDAERLQSRRGCLHVKVQIQHGFAPNLPEVTTGKVNLWSRGFHFEETLVFSGCQFIQLVVHPNELQHSRSLCLVIPYQEVATFELRVLSDVGLNPLADILCSDLFSRFAPDALQASPDALQAFLDAPQAFLDALGLFPKPPYLPR